MYAVVYTFLLFVSAFAFLSIPNKKQQIVLISLLWGGLAFLMHYRSGLYVDTIRFFRVLDETRYYIKLSGISGGWQFLMSLDYSGVPLAGLYVLLLSLVKNNQFFNFTTGFIICLFSLMSILNLKTNHKSETNKIKVMISFLMLFLIYNFQYGVQNVRSPIVSAVSFYMLTWINNHSKNLKNLILFYVILIALSLMHPFALLILVAFTINRFIKSRRLVFLLNIILIFWTNVAEPIVINFFSKFNLAFFQSISEKSNSYLGANGSLNTVSNFDLYRSIAKLMILFIVFYFYKPKFKKYSRV